MNKYGIVDIGSNTIVLIVYEIQDGKPVSLLYRSNPVHLIDTVNEDRVMSRQGIEKAHQAVKEYASIADDMNVKYRFADITEPCRIKNQKELVDALKDTSFEIYPLTGEEEAEYDFTGTRYSCPDITDGIAFDVGGGSTELISFYDSKAEDAVSFPLGCVRLSHLPLDTDACEKEILSMREQYASLNVQCSHLIGIGGTMRAVTMLLDHLYHTGNTLTVSSLKEVYKNLLNNDEKTEEAFHQIVDPARQPVFLPGLHMILEICRIYRAENITFSVTGIREGFLKKRVESL